MVQPKPQIWRSAHATELDRIFPERTAFEPDPLLAAFERGQRCVVEYIRRQALKAVSAID